MPSKRPTAGQAESEASSLSAPEVRALWEEPTEGTDHVVVPVGIPPAVKRREDVNRQQAGVSWPGPVICPKCKTAIYNRVICCPNPVCKHIFDVQDGVAPAGVSAEAVGKLVEIAQDVLDLAHAGLWSGNTSTVENAKAALVTAPSEQAIPEAKPISAWIEQQQQTTPHEQPDQLQTVSGGALSAEQREKLLALAGDCWDREWDVNQNKVDELIAWVNTLLAAHDQKVRALVDEIEMNCPCGARPESLNTHGHVSGCPVAELKALLASGAEEKK